MTPPSPSNPSKFLRGLACERPQPIRLEKAVREALSALNLSRSFLLELADVSDPAMPDERAVYVSAMDEYLKAREDMTCANLKLVFHIAKKYLYSGLPLDDLTQEGKLGPAQGRGSIRLAPRLQVLHVRYMVDKAAG